MTPLTVLDKVVEALQAAGATEEMIAAAVGAAGEFGDSPPRPNGRPRKYANESARQRAWQRRNEIHNEIPAPDAPRNETHNEMTQNLRPIMPPLTERVFNSSFDCQTKCHLLLHGRRGQKTE